MAIQNEFDKWAQNHYKALGGFSKSVPIPISAWLLAAGTPPVAATTNIVGVGAVNTVLIGHIWDSGADAGDVLCLPWTVPSDFYVGGTQGGVKPGLILRVKARKRDSDGTNTTAALALTLDGYWHNNTYAPATGVESDGDATVNATDNHFAAVISSTALPAPVIATAMGGFRWYEFDVAAAIAAAVAAAPSTNKTLQPGATLNLLLSVSDTVGGNDFVEAIGYEILYRGHLTQRDAAQRTKAVK